MATMNGNIIMNAPIEINDVCRGCLDSRREMRPLYGACLDEMLMSITTVQVKKDDGLPSLMCIQCILQLSRAYSFKQTCEKSDATLKLYINAALQDQLSSQRKIESTEEAIDSEAIGDCTLICIDEDNSDGYIELVEFQHDIKTEEQSLDPDEVMKPEMDDISLNENSFDMKGHIGFSKAVNIAPSSSNHLLPGYHCKKCDETFEMEIDFNLHMVLHPPDNKCETCGKSFVERGSLRRHLKTHLENKPHACETCNKTFADLSNLKKHKKTHTGELRNVQGKPHLCSVCGRGFKWASSLSKHSKYHSGRKLLSCKYCTKQYVEARSLRIHMRSHTGEKPYICSVCTRGFTQQSNLEKHLRVHTGERPHICNVCGKGFSQRGYVTIHMRTHTGEKPYVCKTCGKAFSGANTLNTHKRIHTGERPFNCDVCGKFFSRQETLIIHQRTHTGEKPHICTICSKGFSSSSHLSGHMRSHTGVKPHCCNLCDKRFANSSSLKMHMRSHTGEKPFICDYCGEAFICNSSLLSHIMIHTNIAPIVQEPSANLEIVTTNGCLSQWEIDNKSTPLTLPSDSDIKPTTALVTQWIEPSGQIITSTEVAARTLPITQWNMNSKPATLDQTAETGFENLNNVKYSV